MGVEGLTLGSGVGAVVDDGEASARSLLRSFPPRFANKVQVSEDGCWLWTAATRSGYAAYWDGGRAQRGHRWAWQRINGPVPDGLVLDHLCRRIACVNPAHMEPVTMQVNLLRGNTFQAKNAAKTHCKNGHPFSGSNLRVDHRGHRSCRECIRAWKQTTRRRACKH